MLRNKQEHTELSPKDDAQLTACAKVNHITKKELLQRILKQYVYDYQNGGLGTTPTTKALRELRNSIDLMRQHIDINLHAIDTRIISMQDAQHGPSRDYGHDE